MILTNKAKEDFEKWYSTTQCEKEINDGASFKQLLRWLYDEGLGIVLNSFTVEWLDSIGLYIETFCEFGQFGISIHRGDFRDPLESEGHWESRKEATEAAIEKANQIYNKQHGKNI